ncbi:MAG: DUF1493 family protein [Burkholderiales bacterium]|nr:DUF1493 family protein [Burkholderiales bacterium]
MLEIIARAAGRDVSALKDSDRLFHDLRLDGDDAEEVMSKVCEFSGLSPADFPFSKYFGAEFGAGYRHLIGEWLGLAKEILEPLTISDLIQCVEAKTFSILTQPE